MSRLELVVIAAITAAGATWAARELGLRLGLVSPPNRLVPTHRKSIPYLGGLAVATGVVVALGAVDELSQLDTAVAAGAIAFLGIGLLDDLLTLGPGTKLVLQAAGAAAPILVGLRLPLTGIGAVDAVAGLLWILVVVNAVNVTDVCDGLVAGLAAIALVAFAVSAPESRAFALAAAGACIGFLLFNAPPASIFLGDAGSHFLGYCLAVPAIAAGGSSLARDDVIASAVVLAVPLFELVFVVTVRMRRHVPAWQASGDHFPLRLQRVGLSPWRTDLVAWSAACCFGLAGVALLRVDAPALPAVVTVAAVAVAAVAWRRLLEYEPLGGTLRKNVADSSTTRG